jgi:hypothetical protein
MNIDETSMRIKSSSFSPMNDQPRDLKKSRGSKDNTFNESAYDHLSNMMNETY